MSTLTTTSKRNDTPVAGATGMAPARGRAAASGRGGVTETPAARGPVRPFLRRWLTAAMLLAAAVLATLYISNAIAVNDLMTGIASLEKDRDAARASNEKLRAELLKLMAVERVTSIASTRLGMVQPVRPPLSLGAEAHAADPAPSPDQPPAVDSAVVR